MNVREVVEKFLGGLHPNLGFPQTADAFFAALKAEGLFVGPLRSTADMDLASPLDPQSSTDAWDAMVEEWQRTEGA